MLTYTPPDRRPAAEPARESLFLLMLLVFAWLWPGVFSHDLWNPAEPQLFAVIEENAGKTAWLPTLQGQPYFQAAPVYIGLAETLKELLSPWAADAYAAARFASVLFTVLGLAGSGMAAHRLFGAYYGRSTVLILTGSAGLLGMGHFLSGMSVAFAAAGLCLWGLALVRRQVLMAIFLCGTGMVLAGQAAGWLMAAAVWAVMLLLWRLPSWRGRRLLTVWAGTAAVVLPLAAAQLLALAKTDAAAFALYVDGHLFGAFGGLGGLNADFNLPYYARHVLWFAFPGWALAAWTVKSGVWRKQAEVWLPLGWLAVFALLLAVHPQRFQDNLVWLLPPLAVLGALRLDSLRRGVAAFLNWFGMMTFGLAAVFLWLGFFAMNYGFPAKLAERAVYFSPYYVPEIKPMPMLVALAFTPLWLFAVTRKRIRGRQAVTNWAAGMTLVWALLMTLFLPWLDAAKSYRPVVVQMTAALPEAGRAAVKNGTACVYIESAEAQMAWRQYADLPFDGENRRCAYRVYRVHPQTGQLPESAQVLWQGRRPRNKTEWFALVKQ